MGTHALERRLLQASVALFVSAAAIGAPPTAQDPWSKVPPIPTGCYQSQDHFDEKLGSARDAVLADKDRQERMNSEITDQVKAMDASEQARRMQEFMMKNPQDAMKLMQQNQAVGDTLTSSVVQGAENRNQLAAELADLDTRYDAALKTALAPLEAKFKDLDARAQKDLVVMGESWVYAPWAVAEWNAINAQENATYERVCHEWWTASGPYHGWLKRYRDLVVGEIPAREEADNLSAGFMAHLLDTPTTSYRSTAAMAAALEYMDQARGIFKKRRSEPQKSR